MKPEHFLIAGVIAFFVTQSLNRFLGERNYRQLSQEDKVKLIDAFSKHRSLATYIPIGIMAVVIAVIYLAPQTLVVVFPIGIVLMLIFMIVLQMAVLRRLSELSLPNDYIRKFRFQSAIVQMGNLLALPLIAYGVVARLQ
jgi:hypothetical protein